MLIMIVSLVCVAIIIIIKVGGYDQHGEDAREFVLEKVSGKGKGKGSGSGKDDDEQVLIIILFIISLLLLS